LTLLLTYHSITTR